MWRRELSESEKEKKRNQQANGVQERGAARLPSIIRPPSNFEKWTLETKLPEVHLRSVYTVDWSKETGLVVSCGGDGTIAVYQEVPASPETASGEDVVMNGTADSAEAPAQEDDRPKSQWIVVATMEAAHDEYEINHVCWATRLDREKRFEDEEIIVSTGRRRRCQDLDAARAVAQERTRTLTDLVCTRGGRSATLSHIKL